MITRYRENIPFGNFALSLQTTMSILQIPLQHFVKKQSLYVYITTNHQCLTTYIVDKQY